MEKKEISIYWLLDKIITKKHTDSELNYIFQQAEAMHKEEIMKSYYDGEADGRHNQYKGREQYYNETYGGQE